MTLIKYSNINFAIQISSEFLFPVLVLLLVLQSPAVFASNACHEVYATNKEYQFPTKNLTPEVQEAIDRSISGLAELRLSLDLAQVSGRSSMALTALTADYKRKEQALVEYLEKYKIMTKDQLLEKIKKQIFQLQESQKNERQRDERTKETAALRKEEQERYVRETVSDGYRAIFHRVEPGTFMMGRLGKNIRRVYTIISRPFAMMATVTTQSIWKKIAELANSRFGIRYKIDVDPSHFKGDTLPVEQVSYENIQNWIQGLNELSQAGEPSLVEVIPGHKKGDVYRLPSEAEWEFVVRRRGKDIDQYHFADKDFQLDDYAWMRENSGGETHPVAQKKPLVVDGMAFYDLHGNVWEWVKDWYQEVLPGGNDPLGSSVGATKRVFRGKSYLNKADELFDDLRNYSGPNTRYNSVGFRLVREMR